MQNTLVAEVPRFSLVERERRWGRVRDAMRREGVDAIFVPPNTGLWDQFQANVRYLTGIGGNCCQAAAVFPLEGEVTAVTSPDVHKDFWLARQDWVSDIRNIGFGWGYTDRSIERLRELGLEKGRIGVTGLSGNTRFPEGITPHGMLQRLREAFPDAEIINANLLLEHVRFSKSDEELAFIAKADELVEDAIELLAREALPGVPENIVYAHMLNSMLESGGETPSMILWSAGWPQPPSNQYMPSRRKLALGDAISTEAEARWGGYIAQNTQPLFVGKAPEEYKHMFALQQEAVARCYDVLRPGNTVGDVAAAAAAMSRDDYHCSLLMHARGLGDDSPICIHSPRDELMKNWVLEENATFICKPMIRTPDESKRIYWGDTVAVTSRGARRLGKRKAQLIETGEPA
ncbi:Xaa-Pro aminopeptidase [Variovorax sp. YR752]|uniref:M24 family metallopeptidase n=1 Tax=unclassified Variovorax TaxID=663243 RepID=UPI000BD9CDF8|nr:M24 family metallopeptidase [Variovorax sp. YR752]SOE06309.1 Xaa-Pro aminopeptidase [Variovorax sp. YR752]